MPRRPRVFVEGEIYTGAIVAGQGIDISELHLARTESSGSEGRVDGRYKPFKDL